MKARVHNRLPMDQRGGGRCVSCGTSLQGARRSSQAWLLESLMPANANFQPDLCPACRQRDVARRIGAVISTRM